MTLKEKGLATVLRTAMENSELTQREICEKAGMKNSILANILYGHVYTLSNDNALKLSRILQFEPEKLQPFLRENGKKRPYKKKAITSISNSDNNIFTIPCPHCGGAGTLTVRKVS